MKRRTFIIATTMLLFLLGGCSENDMDKQQEIDENITKLKEMESVNITDADTAVATMQKELYQDRENLKTGNINYRETFTNIVVMGDSIAAGLEEYNLLSSIQVVAARGKNLATIDDEIDKVIQLAPSQIFFSYGMNDLGYCRGQTDLFISRYEEVLKKIREGLPNVKFHINAILPIQQHAIDTEPVYGKYIEFNDALKEMCNKMDIEYIDNSSIINDNDIAYAADGIHPVFAFYPYWLSHMAEGI